MDDRKAMNAVVRPSALSVEEFFDQEIEHAEDTRREYRFETEEVLRLLASHKRLRRTLEAIHTYSVLDVGKYHTADLIPCGQDLCVLCLVEGTAKDGLNGRFGD